MHAGGAEVQPLWRRRSAVRRLRDAVADRGLEHLEVDVLQRLEIDAVASDARPADRLSIGSGQVGLVVDAHDVDGDAGCVRAEADSVELPPLLLACRSVQTP
jgi:hypothetical protein